MIESGQVFSVGILLAVLGAFGLAVQSLCIRYGTVKSESAHALVVVLAVNIAFLVPVAFLLERPLLALTPRAVAAFTAAGLIGTMAGRAVYYEGIKRIGASRSESIKASQPLHASLIAVVVLAETVSVGHFLSMVCIVAGIALISYEHGNAGVEGADTSYAALTLPLVAAFLYGIEPTFAKLGFAEGPDVFTGLAVKTVSAAVGFLLYLGWKTGIPRPRSFNRGEVPWIVAAGLANTVFLLGYYAALTLEPVSVVVPLVQSSPLLVIVISAFFVSDDLERITVRLAAGAAAVVAGAVGVTLLG